MNRFLLLILLFAACQKDPLQDDSLEKGASIRLKNFSRKSFSIDGKEEWDLQAKEAYIFRSGDKESRIVAYGLDFKQFDKGRRTGLIQAERGEIDYKKKVLNLAGKVSFTDDKRTVQSEELKYTMEDKILESTASVLLVEGASTTHCRKGISVNRSTNVQVCRSPAVTRVSRPGDKQGFEDL